MALYIKRFVLVRLKISVACSPFWDMMSWEEISHDFEIGWSRVENWPRGVERTGMIGRVPEGMQQGPGPRGLETQAFDVVSIVLGSWGCLWTSLDSNISESPINQRTGLGSPEVCSTRWGKRAVAENTHRGAQE